MKGENYKDAKQVIMINILDYNLFGFDEYISETVTVLEKHRDYKVNSIMKTYYIELPKFRKSNVDMNEKLNQWLAFIDDEDRGKIKMAEEKNKVIREGRIEMNYLTGEAETRRLQELKEKWESDWNSSMSYFNQKGLERGLECAKKKQVKIIRNLLELGMDIETIAKVTEQTLEEVKNIKSKYNL